MNPIVNTVHRTTLSLLPATEQIPRPIWIIFSGAHYIHRLWRWYRHTKVYSNPSNFQSLALGHVLNYVAGDSTLLRIAAQCVLIANRILTCVEQYGNVYAAYQRLNQAIRNHYPRHHIPRWPIKQHSSIYSPSTKQWLRSGWHSAIERFKRIAIALFNVMKELGKLSLCLMDAIETFSLSPTTRNESINQLFVNATQSIDQLVDTQESLREGLTQNREIISSFLIEMGSSYKVEHLISAVETTMKGTKKVQDVAHFGNGILPDIGKRIIYGAAEGLGLAKYLSWQPEQDPKWLTSIAQYQSKNRNSFTIYEARSKRKVRSFA